MIKKQTRTDQIHENEGPKIDRELEHAKIIENEAWERSKAPKVAPGGRRGVLGETRGSQGRPRVRVIG